MSASLISTFYNGDTTTNSITAIEQTLLALYRRYDGMTFGNFEAGNTSAPNIVAGSALVINQSLYRFDSADAVAVMNANGASTPLASAANGYYYLVGIVDVNATCTIYARDASTVTVSYNASYDGWYITATQQRVLGGFRKTGAIYNSKWRYQLTGGGNEGAEFNYRQYVDGLAAKLKVSSDVFPVYSTSTMTRYEVNTVPLVTVPISYPCIVAITSDVTTYALTAVGNNNNAANSMGRFVVTLLADDGVTPIGFVGDFGIQNFGSSTTCFSLFPGIYKIDLVTAKSTRTVTTTTQGRNGPVTTTTVYSSGLQVNSLAVNVRNGLGAPAGKY